jgi:hypothetical protein
MSEAQQEVAIPAPRASEPNGRRSYALTTTLSTALGLVAVFSFSLSSKFEMISFNQEEIIAKTEHRILSVFAITYFFALVVDMTSLSDRFPRLREVSEYVEQYIVKATAVFIIAYLSYPDVYLYALRLTVHHLVFLSAAFVVCYLLYYTWKCDKSSINKTLLYAGIFVLCYELYLFSGFLIPSIVRPLP